MRKTIVTLISTATMAAGALAAAGSTFAPAHALVAPGPVTTLCEAIPGAKTAVAADLDKATRNLAAATTTLATRRTAMTTTITTFGTSIVNFLKVVEAKGNVHAAGEILRGHQSQFVDSVVAWSNARTAVADHDRDITFAQLRTSFLQSAETGCPAP